MLKNRLIPFFSSIQFITERNFNRREIYCFVFSFSKWKDEFSRFVNIIPQEWFHIQAWTIFQACIYVAWIHFGSNLLTQKWKQYILPTTSHAFWVMSITFYATGWKCYCLLYTEISNFLGFFVENVHSYFCCYILSKVNVFLAKKGD